MSRVDTLPFCHYCGEQTRPDYVLAGLAACESCAIEWLENDELEYDEPEPNAI